MPVQPPSNYPEASGRWPKPPSSPLGLLIVTLVELVNAVTLTHNLLSVGSLVSGVAYIWGVCSHLDLSGGAGYTIDWGGQVISFITSYLFHQK
jgi:hypothetical protein